MALVTTPAIQAVITVIMQEKEGTYGPYQSVLFEGEGLKDGKLWRALKPDEAQQLRKGQQVELTPTKTREGKGSWNIRPLNSQPTQPQPAKPAVRSSKGGAMPSPQSQQPSAEPPQSSYQEQTLEERRQQIATYIDSMGDLYAHCLQVAQQKIGSDSDSESIRCMASSLFISAQRRFLLTSPSE